MLGPGKTFAIGYKTSFESQRTTEAAFTLPVRLADRKGAPCASAPVRFVGKPDTRDRLMDDDPLPLLQAISSCAQR